MLGVGAEGREERDKHTDRMKDDSGFHNHDRDLVIYQCLCPMHVRVHLSMDVLLLLLSLEILIAIC